MKRVFLQGEYQYVSVIGATSCFPNLESIEMDAWVADPDALVNFVLSYPTLQEFALGRCEVLEDSYILRMVQGYTRLTQLTLRKCKSLTRDNVGALCEYAPHLESLALEECNSFEREVLSVTAHSLHGTLKHLSIASCNIENVDYSALKASTLFESLDVCNMLVPQSDARLSELVKSLPQLRTLFANEVCVNDAVLCAIAHHCPHIEHISIIECADYTAEGLQALLNQARNLRELNLGSEEQAVLADLAILWMNKNIPC